MTLKQWATELERVNPAHFIKFERIIAQGAYAGINDLTIPVR